MIRHSLQWKWALVALGISACAATPLSGIEAASSEEATEAASFEELCEEASSLEALCTGEQCGLYRCQDVKEHLTVGRVVLARGGAVALPNPQAGAQRNWGSAQELPWDTRPVFIIPWNYKPPLLPSQQELLAKQAAERRKPHERHHIFPQAFRRWFTAQGINIDEYLIPLEVEKHRSIHRGANGGPWNAAWEKFIKANAAGAPKEKIYQYAGQLIYEFELFGPVVPLWKQPPPLPLGY